MTANEANKLAATLLAAYPAARVSQETPRVYARGLHDLDYPGAQMAAERLMRTQKFLPTISELREVYVQMSRGGPRSGEEAWALVMTAIRRRGRYNPPVFKDDTINQALRLWGSWEALCNSPEDDPGGRARFVQLYDSLAKSTRADAVAGPRLALPKPGSRPLPKLELPEVDSKARKTG